MLLLSVSYRYPMRDRNSGNLQVKVKVSSKLCIMSRVSEQIIFPRETQISNQMKCFGLDWFERNWKFEFEFESGLNEAEELLFTALQVRSG